MGVPESLVASPRAAEILRAVRADPGSALVVLDFDGTVAAIHPDPDAVVALPGVVAALTALARRGARIAVVTGRPAHFPVARAGLGAVPGIVVHGRHGVEVWDDGRLTAPEPSPAVAAARRDLAALVASGPSGMAVEDKELSVALHTRGCADPQDALVAVRPAVEDIAERHGLEILAGRYVWELRPPGEDKGDAVRTLVADIGPAYVLVFGDDMGDVPAFRAVRALGDRTRPGVGTAAADGDRPTVTGLAVAVAAPEVPQVAAEADEVLAGPEDVRDLLVWLAQSDAP